MPENAANPADPGQPGPAPADGPSVGAAAAGVGAGVGGSGGGGGAGASGASGRLVDPSIASDVRTYALLMHLTPLLGLVLPVVSVAAPVIMWQVRRTSSPFIDDHGREAVNFHISLMVYALAGIPLSMFCFVGIGVWVAAGILAVVGMVMASIAAHNGEYYRYPMCLRWVK